MIDQAIRETRLIVFNEGDAIFSRDVPWPYDYECVPVDACAERNPFDFAASDAAANGRSIEHARQNHVVHIVRVSGDFVAPFHAGNGGTDDGSVFHSNRGIIQSFLGVRQPVLVYDRQSETGLRESSKDEYARLPIPFVAFPLPPILHANRLSREFAVAEHLLAAKISGFHHPL